MKENINLKRNSTQRLSENINTEELKGNLDRKCSEVSRRHLSVLNDGNPSSRSGSMVCNPSSRGESIVEEEVVVNCSLSADISVFEDSSKLNTTKDSLVKLRNNRKLSSVPVCPPAGAIALCSPPENSTPPFPSGRVRVVSFKTPPSTPLELKSSKVPLLPDGVVDIDLDCSYEYAAEAVAYLKSEEIHRVLPRNFLESSGVSDNMRSILVDWIVQVQHYLHLCQETLYNAVFILDTVLGMREVEADKLQLVGIASVLVASKLEEYYPADIKKLLHLTENSYTTKELLHMEMVLLDVLEFKVYNPTAQDYLLRYTRAAIRHGDDQFLKTCQLLLDCHLPDVSHSCIAPSQLAAASVYTALHLYNLTNNERPTEDLWSPTLCHYTAYKEEQLAPASLSMLDSMCSTKFSGFRTKYKSRSQHGCIIMSPHLQEEVIMRAKEAILYMVD